jgi:hypothetical protein
MSLRRYWHSRTRLRVRRAIRSRVRAEVERDAYRRETREYADRLVQKSKQVDEHQRQLLQFGQLICAIHGVTPGHARRWSVTPESAEYFGSGRISADYDDSRHVLVFTVQAGPARRLGFREWFDWKREW